MADGSRHFAEVPWCLPSTLKLRLVETRGVAVTAFIDSATETWLDFTYAGHEFSVHNPLNDFWLFVRNPTCPEALLRTVELLVRSADPHIGR